MRRVRVLLGERGDARATPPRRTPALDATRAIAMMAMVFGHILEALLLPEIRQEPGVAAYWKLRAATAPLFLLVSGWVVAVSASRRGRSGAPLLIERVPRVLLLLGLGYALRWPLWDHPGLWSLDPRVWEHLLAFDVLHVIGASLALGTAVLALWSDTPRRTLALGVLSLVVVAATPAVAQAGQGPAWPMWLRQMLGGGSSPFPLFPWSAYFFLGALLGLTTERIRGERRTLWILGALALLSFAAVYTLGLQGPRETSPTQFVLRLGMALTVLTIAFALPQALSRHLGPVGRCTLWVYVIHLPVVYGWGRWPGLSDRIGRTLPLGQSLLYGAALFVASTALGLTGRAVLRRWRAGPHA